VERQKKLKTTVVEEEELNYMIMRNRRDRKTTQMINTRMKNTRGKKEAQYQKKRRERKIEREDFKKRTKAKQI
jgi:hypothetical protein